MGNSVANAVALHSLWYITAELHHKANVLVISLFVVCRVAYIVQSISLTRLYDYEGDLKKCPKGHTLRGETPAMECSAAYQPVIQYHPVKQ